MTTDTDTIEAPPASAENLEDPLNAGAGPADAEVEAGQASPAGQDRQRLTVEEFVNSWQGITLRVNALLREPTAAGFSAALGRADEEIAGLIRGEAETSLLLLIHTASTDLQRYSAMHALTVTVVCDLAARLLPDFGEAERRSLRQAALTMNIGMTRLQDQLALQADKVTPDQRAAIDGHATRSVELLREMGVSDELWLEAVLHHHDAPPGSLSELPLPMKLARLVQRADVFVARMSPRKARAAMSAALAAKGAYYDENEKPDEAGSLVIKALGIYPAGSCVQLHSGEQAIVLRRTEAVNKPLVVAIADGNGLPHVQPVVRATTQRSHAIVHGVQPKDVRVRTPVERLLKLARRCEPAPSAGAP